MSADVLTVLLVAVPLLGVSVLALLPDAVAGRAAPTLAVAFSGAVFVLAVVAAAAFDRDTAGRMQMETDVRWIPVLDVRFHVGLDGVSLPLVVLTALLVLLCCVYTLRVRPHGGRLRGFLALVLLLETGML